ncbi:hypothetical protein BKA70DRAFT_1234138 [Coprinopsis sp. MPI-PUGE-AT-0042]|nr:hypothetical protein BKA70DRAFT_1234138 [Coprinopsis sp. MPI-PUGE-AT-0042]
MSCAAENNENTQHGHENQGQPKTTSTLTSELCKMNSQHMNEEESGGSSSIPNDAGAEIACGLGNPRWLNTRPVHEYQFGTNKCEVENEYVDGIAFTVIVAPLDDELELPVDIELSVDALELEPSPIFSSPIRNSAASASITRARFGPALMRRGPKPG